MTSQGRTSVHASLFLALLFASLLLPHVPALTNSSNARREPLVSPPIGDVQPAQSLGTDDVSPNPAPQPAAPVNGPQIVIVIAVEFSDVNHTKSISEINDLVFNSMSNYYREASYGSVYLTGTTVGWFRLNRTIAYYGRDCRVVDDTDCDGAPDSWRLGGDAVAAADAAVNFTQYQYVLVVHAGNGQESSSKTSDIWSIAYLGGIWLRTHERSINAFAIVPETEDKGASPLGVYAHEFAHLLGLPDLYDSYTGKSNLGPWDLMDKGLWNGLPKGTSPAHPIAWNKMRLGWIPPSRMATVNASMIMNVTVDPIEAASTGYQAIRIPVTSSTYYLVEVREKVGFDLALPSPGVIITYVDDGAYRSKVRLKDANPSTTTLDDAAFQVGRTFTDGLNGFTVTVVASIGASYTLTVNRAGPIADIVVDRVYASPSAVRVNDTVKIFADISNQGSKNSGTFLLYVYLNNTLYASFRISIAAGEATELSVTWKAVTGTHTFRFLADATNAVNELSKLNNEKSITIVAGPTLTIQMSSTANGATSTTAWIKINGISYTVNSTSTVTVSVASGTQVVEVQQIIQVNGETRSVFVKWSDGDTSNPRTISVTSDLTLTPQYKTQYLLQVNGNGGTVSGGGWFDAGSSVGVSAANPSNLVEGKSRLIFAYWSGDVSSRDASITVSMDGPRTVTANWIAQYYLTLESPYGNPVGSGWYDANAQAQFSLPPLIHEGNATRRIFVEWTGSSSSASPTGSVVMDGPKSLVATWKTQYYLAVVSSYGNSTGSGWYDSGTQAHFEVSSLVDYENRTRRVFVGWSGNFQGDAADGSLVMDSPKTVVATWKTQYTVKFTVRGLPNETSTNILINGAPLSLNPQQQHSQWFDAHSSLQFSANSTIRINIWNYRFVRWENATGGTVTPPQTLDGPQTFIAVYTRELASLPGCLIATATFGSELAPEVRFLREFRDNFVLSTRAGSGFMAAFNAWYYSFSPTIAQYIAGHESERTAMRILLYPLIGILHVSALASSMVPSSPELGVLLAGLVASSLIGLLYVAPVLMLLLAILRRIRKAVPRTSILQGLVAVWIAALVLVAFGEYLSSPTLLTISTSATVLTTMFLTAVGVAFKTVRRTD